MLDVIKKLTPDQALEVVMRLHDKGGAMTDVEATYCRGVILGIYRYEDESKSEFREWAVDVPVECAGALLTEWRERGQGSIAAKAMNEFIRDRCPNWARYFLRGGRGR